MILWKLSGDSERISAWPFLRTQDRRSTYGETDERNCYIIIALWIRDKNESSIASGPYHRYDVKLVERHFLFQIEHGK